MKEQTRVLERLQVALNHAEDKVDHWAEWKIQLVLKKVECLQQVMETNDRRQAGRI